jgi:predicted MPP superfamily phosphohydrolase
MSKIICIGDVHGRTHWKKIVEEEKDADKIVFIGDYWDSWQVKFEQQRSNFLEILELKRSMPDKVVLLLGNHDYHYVQYGEQYSGYQADHADEIGFIVREALKEKLIQTAYSDGKYLFTHAGVTNTWLEDNKWEPVFTPMLAEEISLMSAIYPEILRFNASNPLDQSGDSITQPPIWVRPRALTSDMLQGCVQVVGHTTQKKEIYISDDLCLIDCPGSYLVIEGDKVWAKNI